MWKTALTFGVVLIASPSGVAAWQPHEVRQLNGKDPQIRLPARFQIVTESWNRVVAVPAILYMPEKDRLLMLVGCDYPHRAYILTSDDRGANWTNPRPAIVNKDGKPSASLGTGLAYLGNGNALFYTDKILGKGLRWFSRDYGKTWGDAVPIAPTSDGKPWSIWDPPLVDRDKKTGEIIRLVETGYARLQPPEVERACQQGYLRFSTDEGKTWSKSIRVPQWEGVSEVALFRAGNGDLLGACRTDIPQRMKDEELDHYEGLGISVSKDDGRTWSTVKKLYDYGRHHPSLVLMPNEDIVMTYVVRKGYVDSKDGFPQFGIEAVVSHDHGRTWDLDHKYILHAWVGNHKGPNAWWSSSQATSSKLLPDGSIITVFGTGYRIQAGQTPRDVGLVRWRLNTEPVNADRTIRDAAIDSDLRNIFDPSRKRG